MDRFERGQFHDTQAKLGESRASRHLEAQEYLESAQREELEVTPQHTTQGERRAYPARGRRVEQDRFSQRYFYFVLAGLLILATAGYFENRRQESNSPTHDPTPPVPTLTTPQRRSVEAYEQLLKDRRTKSNDLYSSFDIVSNGAHVNVRRSPSLYGQNIGQLADGTHIMGDNITQTGDDPYTPEEESHKSAWISVACSAVEAHLINRTSSATPLPSLPESQNMCFVYGELVQREK